MTNTSSHTHKTYPKNGLYSLQWVGNSGGNSFGHSADDENLKRRQLRRKRKKRITYLSDTNLELLRSYISKGTVNAVI